MATLYIPVGYPIGRVPGSKGTTGVIATSQGETSVNDTQLALWQQAFLSHTPADVTEALTELIGEEAPDAAEVESWMDELAGMGLLVKISDDPLTAITSLRPYIWYRCGVGLGIDESRSGVYLVIDSVTGQTLDLEPMTFHCWRLAPYYGNLGALVDELGKSSPKEAVARSVFEVVVDGAGALGYLLPPL